MSHATLAPAAWQHWPIAIGSSFMGNELQVENRQPVQKNLSDCIKKRKYQLVRVDEESSAKRLVTDEEEVLIGQHLRRDISNRQLPCCRLFNVFQSDTEEESSEEPAEGFAPATPRPNSHTKQGGPCAHCEVTTTPQWRGGPLGKDGRKLTFCNKCWTRWVRKGRLDNFEDFSADILSNIAPRSQQYRQYKKSQRGMRHRKLKRLVD